MALYSGSWFDSKWIGKIVHFDTPSYSWKITAKLQEHETRYLQSEFRLCGFYSEASCTFVCEDLKGSTQAIMKIRMQIPYIEDDPSSSIPSSEQALIGLSGHTEREIKALSGLTKAGSSCTPHYITSKHEDQDAADWIPGGFLEYLVMEKVEGIKLSHDILDSLDTQQQIKLLEAFRSSYLECQKCGFINLNPNPKNLIWNAAQTKCYIINWESWCKKAKWHNSEFRWWGLEFDYVEANLVIIASCIPTSQPLLEFLWGKRSLASYSHPALLPTGAYEERIGPSSKAGSPHPSTMLSLTDPTTLTTTSERRDSQEEILPSDLRTQYPIQGRPVLEIHWTDEIVVEYEKELKSGDR